MKWDGPEMGQASNGQTPSGTGPKWDNRARNGMGMKWDRHEMGHSGPKLDGHEMAGHEVG